MTRLEEIRETLRKAGPHPWRYEYHETCSEPHHVFMETPSGDLNAFVYDNDATKNRLVFAAKAKQDIPYLLELVERMRGCLTETKHSLHAVRIAGDIETTDRYSFTNPADSQEIESALVMVEALLDELDQPATPTD